MKKKYLIISILFIFLLTGCNAKYSLKIKDGRIIETLTVIGDSNNEELKKKDDFDKNFFDYSKIYGNEENIETVFQNYYSEEECTNECSFYDKKEIKENGKIGFELSHNFSFEEYSYSTIAEELIPAFSSTFDGRYLTISGGANWNYFDSYSELQAVDLTIDTNYKVVSTNMKKEKNGKYRLSITDSTDSLYITMDTSVIVEEEKKSNYIVYLIVLLFILFISLIVCVVGNRKKYY